MWSRVQWNTCCFLRIKWLMTGWGLFLFVYLFVFKSHLKWSLFPQRFGKAAPGQQIQIQRASSVHSEIIYTQPLSDIPTGRRSWHSTRKSFWNGTLSVEWWQREHESLDQASARRIQDPCLSSLKIVQVFTGAARWTEGVSLIKHKIQKWSPKSRLNVVWRERHTSLSPQQSKYSLLIGCFSCLLML